MERTFDEVEGWLESYPKWRQRIQSLKSQLSHIPGLTQRLELVNTHGQGQKNESVLNEVIKRLRIQEEELPFWELRVKVLQDAIQILPSEDQHFVELKYTQRLDKEQLMARFLMSHSMFYRKRREILNQLYKEVGGENSILWVEYQKEG